MLRIARRRFVGTAEVAALILIGSVLILAAPPAFAAASGTLALSLDPNSNVLEPGGSVTVTVQNTDAKKSTTALNATLTNPTAFQKVDGCSGTALGPGKTCQIIVTSVLASVPSVDQTTTLTVKGKKAGTTSPKSVTLVVFGSGCRVANTVTSTSYTDLQAAIEDASSDDALNIRGTCDGNFTIDKNLTLNGVASAGTPTLDANLVGVTLGISETAAVIIDSLTITGGTGVGGQALGGGIENHGILTLNGSASVSGNMTSVGGGIRNFGTLTMNDSSSVTENRFQAGAGISNEGGSVTMNDDSSVSDNTAELRGAGIGNGGTLTMNDNASVSGNNGAELGGGIVNGGTLTMNANSSVWGNSAAVGGGIVNYEGIGVYFGAVAGVNVYRNTPEDIVQYSP